MPYNFTKTPKEIITVGNPQGIFVEIPLYGDVLNKEAEILERLNNEYQKWTQKLFKLAQEISSKKQIPLAKVLSLISSEDVEMQATEFGEYLQALVNHSLQKPSESQRLVDTALILLQSRVDANITKKDVADMPLEFIKQLNDVVYQEMSREYVAVQTLKEENNLLSEMVSIGEDAIHVCIDLVNTIETITEDEEILGKLSKISDGLSNYFVLKSSLGK